MNVELRPGLFTVVSRCLQFLPLPLLEECLTEEYVSKRRHSRYDILNIWPIVLHLTVINPEIV